MHVGHQSFFSFVVSFSVSVAWFPLGCQFQFPQTLAFFILDAATENKAQDLVYRVIEQLKGYEVHTSTSFHYARDGISVSLRNVSKLGSETRIHLLHSVLFGNDV